MLNENKAVLGRTFIRLNYFIRKEERSEFKDLSFHPKKLEKKQKKPQRSRRCNKDKNRSYEIYIKKKKIKEVNN